MSESLYDLIVIGSGPGGYVGAIRASQSGLRTCIIEKDKPGGVCLNIGCIPTKALVEQAKIFRSIDDLKSIGIKADKADLNYKKVQKKAKTASVKLSKGVTYLLEKNNVEFISGEALKVCSQSVTLSDGRELKGKNILLAMGSSPRRIGGFEVDEERVLSSTGALALEELPTTLTVLGSGAIGIEFAYIMNSFGVKVTVVELLPQILPLEDFEIAASIEASLTKQGIKFIKGVGAKSMNIENDNVHVTLADDDNTVISSEKLLVAIGRKASTDSIDLSETAVQLDEKGQIIIGDYYETKEAGIFAVGDIISSPQLAHVASREAEIAVEYIAGRNPEKTIDKTSIPSAVYCEPQVASFGMSSSDVTDSDSIQISTFPFSANGKAKATGHAEGLVKILSHKNGEILGAHIAGANASEMIHELLLAKSEGISLEKISQLIHVHPSLSESIMEAAKEAFDGAIHI